MAFISRIAPDITQPVDRFHDLSRPSEFNRSDGKSFSGPALQAAEPILTIVSLPGLVILPTNNENVIG
jgi:hypothetical protein